MEMVQIQILVNSIGFNRIKKLKMILMIKSTLVKFPSCSDQNFVFSMDWPIKINMN